MALLSSACVLSLTTSMGIAATLLAQTPWTHEAPGGQTACAFDSRYGFFHRDLSNATDVLIYFQGGGACWDWVSCSGLFDTSVTDDELAPYRGIFDDSNSENPFREFGIVFVPYCTGDVHVGAATRQYGDDASARAVYHRGFRNVTAVLDWLAIRIAPRRIVVAGASAGSYGALFYTPVISRRFPAATTIMIGDSGVPLLHNYSAILEHWGASTALRDLWGIAAAPHTSELSLKKAHAHASRGGAVRIAQITSDRDAIQSAFFLISGSHEWRTATYQLLDDVEASVPNVYSYVVAGSDHGLLRTDRFYEYRAGDVLLRDWVSDLIGGAGVRSIRCAQCRPE